KAQPMSVAAGRASSAHHDVTTPASAHTTRNATAYTSPRSSAHAISPTATSRGPSGVASTESYRRAYLSLKNTCVVESKTAPFIADAASSAGATKIAYWTTVPSSVRTSPTSAPMPTPIANRKKTGSKKPDTMIVHVRRNER